jgi:hypothetical protein
MPAPAREAASEAVEPALVTGVRRDRRADFDARYRRYHPRLWRFLTPLMRQPDAIEEALNDTLLLVPDRSCGRGRLGIGRSC